MSLSTNFPEFALTPSGPRIMYWSAPGGGPDVENEWVQSAHRGCPPQDSRVLQHRYALRRSQGPIRWNFAQPEAELLAVAVGELSPRTGLSNYFMRSVIASTTAFAVCSDCGRPNTATSISTEDCRRYITFHRSDLRATVEGFG